MKSWVLTGVLCSGCIFGDVSLDPYFSYLQKLQQTNGNYAQGEIEVIVDPTAIEQVSKIQESRLLRKGFSDRDAKEFSRVGIVHEDQYLIWIRDAVYFPKKVPGTYDRIIWRNELQGKPCGVAVLPVLASGRILLNLNYRHATRSWELELPRGVMLPDETCEEAALREVKEETGATTSDLMFLGHLAPDTGILSSVIPVFMGKVTAQGKSAPDESEAIATSLAFTKEELREGLLKGHLKVLLQGKEENIPLRDGFLTFALLQAELRNAL
jgi:ADP-ribose pyrophosphatase